MAESSRYYTAPEGPDVQPTVEMPRRALFELSTNPEMFGGSIAMGLRDLGKGATEAGDQFGQIAADQALNGFVDESTKLRTDLATKQGQEAIEAYRDYPKAQQDLFDKWRGTVPPGFQMGFDRYGRRYLSNNLDFGATHNSQQQNIWGRTVADSKTQTAIAAITAHPEDDAAFELNSEQMAKAAINEAQLKNGIDISNPTPEATDILINAKERAKGAAAYARIEAARANGRMDLASKWTKDYAGVLGKLGDQAQNQLRTYERNQGDDSYIAGLEARGGATQFAGGGGTFDLIRQREGFISSPRWDVNHYRVGYGSDTITRADGTVEEVKPGMTVTRADAERDLARRVHETQNRIAVEVGPAQWNALPEYTKAALTSMSYNYGMLPFDVAAAVRGGTTEDIARSIARHQNDNGGVNRSRRLEEASIANGQRPIASYGGPALASQPSSPEGNPVVFQTPSGPVTSGSPMMPTTASRPFTPAQGPQEGGAKVQQAAYEPGAAPQAGFGPMGGAPPVDQRSAWDIDRDKTSWMMQETMADPNIDEEKKDRIMGKLEKRFKYATYMAQEDSATRARHSSEAIDRSLQMAIDGNPAGAFSALDDAFRRGIIDEPAYERGQVVIEKRTGQEDRRSYGNVEGYNRLSKDVRDGKIGSLNELQQRSADDGISAKGYERLRRDWIDDQKPENEQYVQDKKLALDMAEKWFKWEIQGPTASTSIRNPKGDAMMLDFTTAFGAEADDYRKTGNPWSKFRLFDSKNLQEELEKRYPEKQKTQDQTFAGMTALTPAQAAELDKGWTGAPRAPGAASAPGWAAEIAAPPIMKKDNTTFPLPHTYWDSAVATLFDHRNDPQAVTDFDERFGPEGRYAKGASAADVLKKIVPAERETGPENVGKEEFRPAVELSPEAQRAIQSGQGAVEVGTPQPQNFFSPELRRDIGAGRKFFGTVLPGEEVPPESTGGP